MRLTSANGASRGFTMVEMLVSVAAIVLILTVLSALVDSTGRTWRYTSSRIEQFQEAREAFETISRKLSQATLNTYWDYIDATGNPRNNANRNAFIPHAYVRQSDLRFICGGELAGTVDTNPARPTHAIFFQAPLGEPQDPLAYGNLEMALNTVGYYLEFASDKARRPPFIMAPERYRCRLMELMEPLESVYGIFHYTSTAGYAGKTWFSDLLDAGHSKVIADNVVALVMLPKLSAKDDPSSSKLASDYGYDSTVAKSDPTVNSRHQLPPIVQLTLIAIDEESAARLASRNGNQMPDLGLKDLFKTVADFQVDLATLEATLQAQKINYRIFSSDITLWGARWSREQTQ